VDRLTEIRLRWLLGGLSALFLIEILAVKALTARGPIPVHRWQVGLMMLVPLAVFVVGGFLGHAMWWRRARGWWGQIQKGIFWFFQAAIALIWIGIFWWLFVRDHDLPAAQHGVAADSPLNARPFGASP
jgi:hypothetical protein